MFEVFSDDAEMDIKNIIQWKENETNANRNLVEKQFDL